MIAIKWKKIPDYPNYEVSNYGDIRSLDRMVPHNYGGLKCIKGRILKLVILNGYYVVSLCEAGSYKQFRVHRLVYQAFKGELLINRVLDHIDNNPLNNYIGNLRQVTFRENSTNRKNKGSSNYTGVSFHSRDKIFNAHIHYDGKLKYLGSFTDELEAAQAYQQALKQIL